ncbi:GNAT family N-acetyltransferase [Amnibacterium sp.]|uniref:GNAT family N-acetyltransferase n=1 Tax=Amnibacterium sp. TaxID=1872496 RepID=UPI00261CC601|nr:GNAT family N-acetyltransferase [Amnibacterium sp.]MCU1473731.1 GCN5-like N-acetyltransferase [Amnibacterium sp.]
MTPEQLRDLYDARLRPWVEPDPAPGVVFERFGHLVRVTGRRQGFVETGPDVGLEGAALDAAIALHRDHFAARGEEMEWKTRAHDRPADLVDRLLAAGFEPEEPETVLVGVAAEMTGAGSAPAEVPIRRTEDPTDFARIAAMESAVWGEDWTWLGDDLAREVAHDREHFVVFLAEADGEVVSAAWLASKPGTGFAGLWGGSTLSGWRGRGIYRALVATRARAALERGAEYLQVDASEDSRPILERLGFAAVTTTTPYVWRPSRPSPADA